MTDNGTRIVVARIQVDPDDPTKCGRDPDCDGFLSLPREALQCGLFKSKTWGKGSHFRCPACLAAEVEVDEDARKIAEWTIEDTRDCEDANYLARAHLALLKVLK